jgi:hypothetical protein
MALGKAFELIGCLPEEQVMNDAKKFDLYD